MADFSKSEPFPKPLTWEDVERVFTAGVRHGRREATCAAQAVEPSNEWLRADLVIGRQVDRMMFTSRTSRNGPWFMALQTLLLEDGTILALKSVETEDGHEVMAKVFTHDEVIAISMKGSQ